jgi:hypothetical protein
MTVTVFDQPVSLSMPAILVRAAFGVVIAAAFAVAVIATPREAADPDLTHLLRAMAAIKAVMALVSVRKLIESFESVGAYMSMALEGIVSYVILWSAPIREVQTPTCGRPRTAPGTTAASCAIPVI